MTPEELDEARARETLRRLVDSGQVYCHEDIAALGARLAREGWTPPEPEPVDPDLLAYREWASHERHPAHAIFIKAGDVDEYITCDAFLAGARMAREQERERAKVLVEYVEKLKNGFFLYATYRELAAQALAKYRGEA